MFFVSFIGSSFLRRKHTTTVRQTDQLVYAPPISLHCHLSLNTSPPPTTMADYGVEPATGEDQELYEEDNQQYNDYGAEEQPMDMDDVPVSQEDAWAVIS